MGSSKRATHSSTARYSNRYTAEQLAHAGAIEADRVPDDLLEGGGLFEARLLQPLLAAEEVLADAGDPAPHFRFPAAAPNPNWRCAKRCSEL